MNKSFGQDDPRLAAYVHDVFHPEDTMLAQVRERARQAGLPDIHVAPQDGRLLELMARTKGARRAVEVGTLGGYSGVCLLRGMGADGTLHTFEIDPAHATFARETFAQAGLTARATVHLGPATARLPDVERHGPFDLVFIDADKLGYPTYLAWAEHNLAPGGIVLLDNAFLFGRVADDAKADSTGEVAAMQSVYRHLATSPAWRGAVIPTGEGLAWGVRV